jgi:hypothetical protein
VRRYEYDVALSYAGEDRSFVEEVASILKARGVAVFYDRFESVDLWGKNLYTHFQEIFTNKARYVVVFISHAYVEKAWTKRELAAALSRPQTKGQPRIWPARFDDTSVVGLSEEIAYEDLQQHSPASFADHVYQKLVLSGVVPDVCVPDVRTEEPSPEEEYVDGLARAILASCGIDADSTLVPQPSQYWPRDTIVRQKVLDLVSAFLPASPQKVKELLGSRKVLLETAYEVANDSRAQPDIVFYLPAVTVLQGDLSTANLPWGCFPEAAEWTEPERMEMTTILTLDRPVSVREHPLSRPYGDPWMRDWDGIQSIHLIPVPRWLDAAVTRLNNSHVDVLGTVWPSQNQHHHTDVLLNTLGIRPAESTVASN